MSAPSDPGSAAPSSGLPGQRPGQRPGNQRPGKDAGTIDLLGLLAYGELSGFERLAADAALTLDLTDKARMAEIAAEELRHFALLRDRLVEHRVDVAEAMAPFRDAIEAFHERTQPADWLEGLVKAYIGNGIAVDFYREVAGLVDERTRALVLEVLSDSGHAEFAVDRVREAIDADPQIAGRLALWGRRLVGEALAQAQHVVDDREALLALLMPADGTLDVGAVQRIFLRITEHHARRMASLGLSA